MRAKLFVAFVGLSLLVGTASQAWSATAYSLGKYGLQPGHDGYGERGGLMDDGTIGALNADHLAAWDVTAPFGSSPMTFDVSSHSASGHSSGAGPMSSSGQSGASHDDFASNFVQTDFQQHGAGPDFLRHDTDFSPHGDGIGVPNGPDFGNNDVNCPTPLPVPGPLAGAGLPGLLLLCGGLAMWERRKKMVNAASTVALRA